MNSRTKVFISWSGPRSQYVAEQLRDWLPSVLQGIDPWMSTEDIRLGTRGLTELAHELQGAAFGILCMTRENLVEPWIMFEAGAISKQVEQSLVIPYVIGLKPTDLKGPLGQFQGDEANENGTRKLVDSINAACGESALTPDQLKRAFDKWWPDLEERLDSTPPSSVPHTQLRTDRDLIEEILERVRRLPDVSAQLLASTVSGPSGAFDINDPKIKAVLGLARTIIINDSSEPVEIGINTVSHPTGYGRQGMSPERIAEQTNISEVRYLESVPPMSYRVVGGFPFPSMSGNLIRNYQQARARKQNRPDEITSPLETQGFFGRVLRYDGTSLSFVR